MQRRILRCDRLNDGVCCEGRIAGLVPVALGCCGAGASRCLIIVGQLLRSGGKRSAEKISPEGARLDCRDPDAERSQFRCECLGNAAATFSGWREVATTKSPRRNAVRTSSLPKPCDVPVMNQTRFLDEDELGAVIRVDLVIG